MRTKSFTLLRYLVISALLILSGGVLHSQTPIWEENFDGTSINKDVWTYDVGGSGMGNQELENYTDRATNAYIENGNLVIQAKRENFGSNQFTSARLKTQGRFAFKYGTIEARIKIPDLKNGLWPAFWLMGNNIGQVGWPKCGEFDILEAGFEQARLADSINKLSTGAVHWWHETGTWSTWLQADASAKFSLPTGNFYDDYHIFKMVWDNTHVEMWVDSKMYFTMNTNIPEMSEFRAPQFILLNLAVGGKNYVNITDPAQITAPLPAKMYVDYIRIYPIAGQTELYPGTYFEKSGNYGVYTENPTATQKLDLAGDGHLYVWNNMTATSGAAYEGSQVLNYSIAAGNWWGMGFFTDENKNMRRYSDGYLHFAMKTTSTDKIGVGVTSANGETYIDLVNGQDQFGLVRDGQWHEVNIPLNRFAVDFTTIYQLFCIKGDAPTAAFNISIDDIYWKESVARPTPENGNFGVFTDNTSCVMKFTQPADGSFYIWSGTLNTTNTNAPKEGSNVLSLASAAGQTWFGAAFTPNVKYNLTAFRYSTSKLHFDMKTSSATTFQIGMKSGNVTDIGQKWITFQSGADPYGFVRDGQWHSVDIPMTDFDNVDLSQVSQLFELLGTAGAISDIAIDNIYFTGGGTAIKDGTTVSVTGVTVAPTSASVNVGATTQLTATVSPSDATNKTVTWSSSNTGVATVSSSGLVTGVAAGNATITVATQDGNKTATCAITVTNPTIAVTGVTVSPTTVSVNTGATSQLTATVSPSNATNKTVTWSSSNTAIATVSTSGLVTGVAAGSATITVTTQSGAKTATCAVTVTNPAIRVTGVTVSPTTASIAVGGTSQLTATVSPTNASNKSVTWTSSNTGIATVSASGLVTGVAAGSATITVTTTDGSKTATCAVTITGGSETPYGGTPWAIPGVIEAENFDNGGEGVAYHDADAANSGGAIRTTEGVDIEACGEGGYDVGWTNAGEWLKYTVNIAAAGNYNIDSRVAAPATGGSFRIEIDGVDKTGTLSVPATGGWQTYVNVSATNVALTAGQHIMRFYMISAGFNLNKITFSSNGVSVTGVTVSPTTVSVATGATSQLTATVSPSNATNKTVTWASSNTGIATVSSTGLVTGVAAGNATITVTTQDGAKTATCAVTVTSSTVAVTGVTLSPTTVSIAAGATSQLTATVSPSNATNKTVTWASSNTAVATVSSSGLVTGVAAGSATITVTTQSGAKTATCAVTVTANTTNIALNKPATASSYEANFVASGANDGSTVTRWSSLFTDPQWIVIDLQAVYNITQVKLNWETASGKNYTIDVSNDNATWVTKATVTNGTVGANITTLNLTGVSGRYIRMNGTARNTQWGFSLLEFEVYGSLAKAAISNDGISDSPVTFYPNPVIDRLTIQFGDDQFRSFSVYDVSGRLFVQRTIESGAASVSEDLSGLKSGVYIVRLNGTTKDEVFKVIKK